jgi:hypothetical protein
MFADVLDIPNRLLVPDDLVLSTAFHLPTVVEI